MIELNLIVWNRFMATLADLAISSYDLTSVIEPEKLGALVRQHSNVSAEHHG